MSNTLPTNIPSGDRRTTRVTLPEPVSPASVVLFVSEDGKRWRLAGHDAEGGRLFVPERLDPAKVARLWWATESYLAEACGVLTPLGGAS